MSELAIHFELLGQLVWLVRRDVQQFPEADERPVQVYQPLVILELGRIREEETVVGLSRRQRQLLGSGPLDLQYDGLALIGLTLLAMTIAVTRFRRTLD